MFVWDVILILETGLVMSNPIMHILLFLFYILMQIRAEEFFNLFFSDDSVNFHEVFHTKCGDKGDWLKAYAMACSILNFSLPMLLVVFIRIVY